MSYARKAEYVRGELMTRMEAIAAADRAAGAAFNGAPFKWTAGLGAGVYVGVLARFVREHPDATAAELYRFATAGEFAARPWDSAPLQLRVALEVFRATYLALLRLIEADGRVTDRSVGPHRENDL